MRKWRVFWKNHWVKVLIGVSAVALIILSVWGLMSLESFYRKLTIANIPLQLLLTALNAFIFVYFYMTVFRGGFGGMHKTKVKANEIQVKFNDVIGLEGAKKEAMEVVKLIRDRALVKKIGGKIVKGILLIGPPGCGKTLLAKAIASEAKMPFLAMSGSEFVEIFVGVGASRVRKLFAKAREYAYSEGACIVFIDEIEVIGRGRTHSYLGGGEETNSTQNQLLVEIDGLESKAHNIIVIGATNADESVLDKALLRPGRFDRKIFVGLPNLQEREEIYKYYFSKVKYDPSIEIGRLARKSVMKSPADIENIIKEGALIAARNGRESIIFSDLSEAMDRIELGLETHLIMSPKEKEQTAYHEAGHAVALFFIHPTDDVFKATIKSRGHALGMVTHHPREELHTHSSDKLIADIMVCLAGYITEKKKYGMTSNGVLSDFQKATAIAHAMVWQFGMGPSGVVGDCTVIPQEELSNSLKEKLNNETMLILNSCLSKMGNFLEREWKLVEALAEKIIKEEEVDYDDIVELFNSLGMKKESVDVNNLLKLDIPK